MAKKILTILASLSFVIMLLFIITFATNETYIKNYQKNEYNLGYLNIMGFSEPYIYPYNIGDSYYQMGMYKEAEKKFREALQKNPPEKDDRNCKVRINLALSMVKQLNLNAVNEDNVGYYIAVLEDARDILVEDGCAHMNDDDGHNYDAQVLKNEIDALIEQLKNPPSSSGSDDNNQNQGGGDGGGEDETETSDGGGKTDEEQSLQDLQNAANEDRYQYSPDNYDYMFDWDFYYGPNY